MGVDSAITLFRLSSFRELGRKSGVTAEFTGSMIKLQRQHVNCHLCQLQPGNTSNVDQDVVFFPACKLTHAGNVVQGKET